MATMKSAVILVAMLAAASPALSQTIEATNRTRWGALPSVKMKSSRTDLAMLSSSTEQILAEGKCNVPGLRPNKFDIDRPYAVLVTPSGSVQRIVIGETGCPDLNSLLGTAIHQWAQEGRFSPTGEAEPRWYVGRISYAQE